MIQDILKIKKGKKDSMYNTQTMLPISEIQEDTVILKDGWLRSIIQVQGINLDLKNDDEATIVLEQYKRFLNGLWFPIQILIRNTYLDLSEYIQYMENNISNITNEILKDQGQQYINFLDNINMSQWMIFVKEFYIVVPYYDSGDKDNINKPRRQKVMNILESKDGTEKIVQKYRQFIKNKKYLDTRNNLIIDGLRWLGLEARIIRTSDIVSLLFRAYNPLSHTAQSEVEEE